jgi:group II intron reverse transcriptase/maturase
MLRQTHTTLTELESIAARARREPTGTFVNLMHMLSAEFLADCFQELRRRAAPGVDGASWEAYAAELPQHLARLVDWLKRGQYWPQPVRRVYIPKDERGRRPLGIPTIQDKLVQLAMVKILTAIFEGDFLPVSYGYRPGRDAHQALRALETALMTCPMTTVIEVDIKGFFDSVDHAKLLICLQQRVGDRKFLRLVERFLKAGVMEEGRYQETEQGTPQGGILSPILSNIFLHYALDRWFTRQVVPRLAGDATLFRYADDFVICTQDAEEARWLLGAIRERFARCGLAVSEEKTRLLSFGRKAWERWRKGGGKPQTFDFLGFTHYVGTSRKGTYKVGRVTSRKKFRRSLKALKAWLKGVRNLPLRDWWSLLAVKVRGHIQYYGVSGNFPALARYYDRALQLVVRALARRSQRSGNLWPWLHRYLKRFPLPRPKIIHAWYAPMPVR